MTGLHYIMLGVLILSAAVQFNDPDPWAWILIYLSAAFVTLLAIRQKLHWPLTILVAIISLVWSVYCLTRISGPVSVINIISTVDMKTLDIELAREAGGLIIVLSWMVYLLIRAYQNNATQDVEG